MVMSKKPDCNVDQVHQMLTKHIPEAKLESKYSMLLQRLCYKYFYIKDDWASWGLFCAEQVTSNVVDDIGIPQNQVILVYAENVVQIYRWIIY